MNTIGSSFDKLKFFCLIGMSGVGKSYWTNQLKQEGYQVFSCDEYIFKILQEKLNTKTDFMVALAEWLGFPENATYEDRAKEYLHYENLSLQAAIDFYNSHDRAVIDSSGSLVICQDDLIRDLKNHGPLVYLESDQSFYERITHNFINNPKPVIWSDDYNTNLSVRENFTNLIKLRANKYQSYADITLNSNKFKTAKTASDFLKLLNNEHTR